MKRAHFTCSDCSASFRHFNMLANHVQLVHDDAGRKESTKAKTAVLEATTMQQLAYPPQKVSHPDPNAKPQSSTS